jgi:hypothetical protein
MVQKRSSTALERAQNELNPPRIDRETGQAISGIRVAFFYSIFSHCHPFCKRL